MLLEEFTLLRPGPWDPGIDAPAGATGEEKNTYTVEYDRNFQLASPSGTQQLQHEFEQLQRGRLKLKGQFPQAR